MTFAEAVAARVNMVEKQIRPNRVTDRRIFDAMLEIPREEFLPDSKRAFAYMENPIEVAPSRFLLAPMIFARLMQEAQIRAEDRILDVGCLLGYSSAVLARIGGAVTAIDCDSALVEQARTKLAGTGHVPAEVRAAADLTAGYPDGAPYDLILCEGSADFVPETLKTQLDEGGRLLILVNRTVTLGQAMIFERIGGTISGRVLFEATVPRLPGFEQTQGFVFA